MTQDKERKEIVDAIYDAAPVWRHEAEAAADAVLALRRRSSAE